MDNFLSRRDFLKTTGAVTAGSALACALPVGMRNLKVDYAVAATADEEQSFTCGCSWSCSFCQYNVIVRNGNVSNIRPLEGYDQRTCLRGKSRIQRTYSEERIRYPMKRVEGTARGEGQWERISWDEAADLIVTQWQKTAKEYGSHANTYYQCSGSQGSLHGNAGLVKRLFNALEVTIWDYSFDIATNTGLTRGGIQWFDQNEPKDFVNSDAILCMGANPVNANIQNWQFIANAQEQGVQLVCVDPLFSPTVAKADRWIRVLPGTDPALYLGLCNKFIQENLYHSEFVLNHTCAPFLVKKKDGMYLRGSEFGIGLHVGPPFWVTGLPTEIDPIMVWDKAEGKPVPFDEAVDPIKENCPDENYVTAWDLFKEHVKEWDFKKVHEVTNISEEDFEFLADLLLPEHKIAHYINFGTGAYENGLHAAYALTALISLTGNFGEPGRSVGGFDFMYGNFFGHALCTPSNGAMMNMISILSACDIMREGKLEDGTPYPVKNLWVTHGGLLGGNVNSNRLKAEFLDHLEQIIVTDPFMTETARYADIVLPACDMYEYEDVVPLSHECNVRLSDKAIDPLWEAKPDAEIARFFGEKFGLADVVCDVSDEDWWKGTFEDVEAARKHGITIDTLRKEKRMRYVDEEPYIGNRDLKNFITETGRLMFYTEDPQPRTASFYKLDPEREKMPTYFENYESGINSELKEKFPFVCMSWRNPIRVHTTMFMKTWAHDVSPEPTVYINPADAQQYGIEHEDYVDLYNDRGHCVAKAIYHEGMQPGIICYPKGYQANETKAGSLSEITTDLADPYAMNCSFFDNRVAVRLWDGEE